MEIETMSLEDLNGAERDILFLIIKLDESYGMEILRMYNQMLDGEVSSSTVYNATSKLKRTGLIKNVDSRRPNETLEVTEYGKDLAEDYTQERKDIIKQSKYR